jgi:hypothetical protein
MEQKAMYRGTKLKVTNNKNLVHQGKNLDTAEQNIMNNRTHYECRWNTSLPPENHGTNI